jgi:hypothetical protein
MSVQLVERTPSIHASGVQASGASGCPDGQACGVRAAAAGLSAPRWTGILSSVFLIGFIIYYPVIKDDL